MKNAIISALLAAVPAFTLAEPAPNTISGTIGGLEMDAAVWSEQSDFSGDGNSGSVSILTRPVAPDQGLGILRIGFEGSDFMGGDIFSAEVGLSDTRAENMSEYSVERDDGLELLITRSESINGTLSISGKVQGTLTWRQLMPIVERREDASRRLPIELEFNAVLENEY
ncbi:hypothetical protein ACRDNQ_01870 [Palleronia sp. KMU-117]|uniref:hypothetical protein n=1 Tax=Palleronia sp. KMU-117 TaxID=3434108 RepID=UPI003D71F9CE